MSIEIGPKRIAPVGHWAQEKLGILRCYLGTKRGGFLPATRKAGRRFYVDLFSGPGQDIVRGTDEVIDGSPLIALKAGPPRFDGLYWVDSDPRNVASLRTHQGEHPERQINVYAGDANLAVGEILDDLPKEFPVFTFLDPHGAELDWQTIVKLARHKATGKPKVELFVLFPYNHGLVRLLPYDPAKMVNETVLDRVMPDARGWRVIYDKRVAGELNRADPKGCAR